MFAPLHKPSLIAQAAEVLARFGLIVPTDVADPLEFLRHIITAAATSGAARERAAAGRKREEQQRRRDDDVDGATYLSASLFDPEDYLPLPE